MTILGAPGTINRRERVVAALLALAGALLSVGAGLVFFPAGLIVAGLALAAWTVVTFVEVGS